MSDHDRFRRRFAILDDLSDPAAELRSAWEPLAALLEVHASAEEEIFYPELLRRGEDTEGETVDAIRDHNDIRSSVHEAMRHDIGSAGWWESVRRARVANSAHMAEEEDDALPDFRHSSGPELRAELGRRFLAFKAEHAGARGIDTADQDPQGYVESFRNDDVSLGIGSLKGR